MPAEAAAAPARAALGDLAHLLRCPSCGASVAQEEGTVRCAGCGARYPVTRGTVRMVAPGEAGAEDEVKRETAESFAYEWERFGELREEWRKNFLDYMRPHDAAFLDGIAVLDVGTGSGRHSHQAASLGAKVAAVDLGPSIDVARVNLPDSVLTVQADAERLPFAPESFDLVMSIGVLHHLPDPERAFRAIVPFARPGGWVQIYLYWRPPRGWHRTVLRLVTAARRLTTKLPHRLLHLLCYPLAAALWVGVVLPYRALRGRTRLAEALPLKTYADYPFGVLVNDQFDRFSAPIENRYEREEVERWLRDAGLEEITVLPHHGWLGSGRRPVSRAGDA